MDFWDYLVFRLCMGLGEGHFAGFNRAERLLELAVGRGLFSPAAMSPPSRALMLLVCRATSPVYQAICPAGSHHGFSEADLWAHLQHALRPRLADLHALGHYRGPAQQGMVEAVYRAFLVPGAVAFLSRFRMIEEAGLERFVGPVLHQVFPAVGPALPDARQAARVRDDVEVALYHRLLGGGALFSPVPPWPTAGGEPTWLTSTVEVSFLRGSGSLSANDRCLLLLSVYAQLPIRTLVRILRRTGIRTSQVAGVSGALYNAWWQVILPM